MSCDVEDPIEFGGDETLEAIAIRWPASWDGSLYDFTTGWTLTADVVAETDPGVNVATWTGAQATFTARTATGDWDPNLLIQPSTGAIAALRPASGSKRYRLYPRAVRTSDGAVAEFRRPMIRIDVHALRSGPT